MFVKRQNQCDRCDSEAIYADVTLQKTEHGAAFWSCVWQKRSFKVVFELRFMQTQLHHWLFELRFCQTQLQNAAPCSVFCSDGSGSFSRLDFDARQSFKMIKMCTCMDKSCILWLNFPLVYFFVIKQFLLQPNRALNGFVLDYIIICLNMWFY